MKTIRKISLLVAGVMLASLFLSSCSAGHASSRHKHPASGSKMF